MKGYDKHLVDEIRKEIVRGTKLRLIWMQDDNPYRGNPLPGAVMTVDFIDDLGQIHGTWSTGGSLALLPGIDEFEIIQ